MKKKQFFKIYQTVGKQNMLISTQNLVLLGRIWIFKNTSIISDACGTVSKRKHVEKPCLYFGFFFFELCTCTAPFAKQGMSWEPLFYGINKHVLHFITKNVTLCTLQGVKIQIFRYIHY